VNITAIYDDFSAVFFLISLHYVISVGFHIALELVLFVGHWHPEDLCYFRRFVEPHYLRLQGRSNCPVAVISTNLIT